MARADIPRVMGPPNRPPGTPLMGAPDFAGGAGIMGGPDASPGVGRATGFELAEAAPSGAAGMETVRARNRAFAAAGGHEGAVVFPDLRLFVITCLDPRVDPAHFLGLGLGEAMVVRNVGGRVTPEVINDIAFIAQLAESALPDGPLFEVAVIHHNQCGTGALADDSFRHAYARHIGAEEESLLTRAVLVPAATVTHDVELLRAARSISSRVTVSGHVYDVSTGLMQTMLPAAAGTVPDSRSSHLRRTEASGHRLGALPTPA